jgi:ankyrin repeat protein
MQNKAMRRWAMRLMGAALVAATFLLALDGRAVRNALSFGPHGDELLLDSAAGRDLPGVLRALDEGANVEARDVAGVTPLLFACSGDLKIAQVLLDHGAKPSNCTADGLSPLHIAVIYGDVQIVELLLSKGAVPNVVVSDQTPIDIAETFEHPEMIKVLRAHGGKSATELSRQ